MIGALLQLVVPVSSLDREGSRWTWWDQAWGQWDLQTSSQNSAWDTQGTLNVAWDTLGASCLGRSRNASQEMPRCNLSSRQAQAGPSLASWPRQYMFHWPLPSHSLNQD